MYQIGDQVVYGIHGVCCVMDVEERMVDKKPVSYLALEPVGQSGTRYFVPTHNAAAMSKLRPMLSRAELEALLSSAQVHTDCWIKDENHRKQAYRELISKGDMSKLLQMVRSLYWHREAQLSAGRKCHICDENFLRDAERLISGEIGLVMEMSPEDAKKYLQKKMNEDA